MAGCGANCAACLWRQWKRAHVRAMNPMKAGLQEEGAWPMIVWGLVSLLDMVRRFQCFS